MSALIFSGGAVAQLQTETPLGSYPISVMDPNYDIIQDGLDDLMATAEQELNDIFKQHVPPVPAKPVKKAVRRVGSRSLSPERGRVSMPRSRDMTENLNNVLEAEGVRPLSPSIVPKDGCLTAGLGGMLPSARSSSKEGWAQINFSTSPDASIASLISAALDRVLRHWYCGIRVEDEAGPMTDQPRAKKEATARTMRQMFQSMMHPYCRVTPEVLARLTCILPARLVGVIEDHASALSGQTHVVLTALHAFFESSPTGVRMNETWDSIRTVCVISDASVRACLDKVLKTMVAEFLEESSAHTYAEFALDLASYPGGVFMFTRGSDANKRLGLELAALPDTPYNRPGDSSDLVPQKARQGETAGRVYALCARQLMKALKGIRRRTETPESILDSLRARHDVFVVTPDSLVLLEKGSTLACVLAPDDVGVLTVETDDSSMLAIVAQNRTIAGLLEHHGKPTFRICHHSGAEALLSGPAEEPDSDDDFEVTHRPEDLSLESGSSEARALAVQASAEIASKACNACVIALQEIAKAIRESLPSESVMMMEIAQVFQRVRQMGIDGVDFPQLYKALSGMEVNDLMWCVKALYESVEGQDIVGQRTALNDLIAQLEETEFAKAPVPVYVPLPSTAEENLAKGARIPANAIRFKALAPVPEDTELTAPAATVRLRAMDIQSESSGSGDEWRGKEDDPFEHDELDEAAILAATKKRLMEKASFASQSAKKDEPDASSTDEGSQGASEIGDAGKADFVPRVDVIPQPPVGLPEAPVPYSQTPLGAKAEQLGGTRKPTAIRSPVGSSPLTPDDTAKGLAELRDRQVSLAENVNEMKNEIDAVRVENADLIKHIAVMMDTMMQLSKDVANLSLKVAAAGLHTVSDPGLVPSSSHSEDDTSQSGDVPPPKLPPFLPRPPSVPPPVPKGPPPRPTPPSEALRHGRLLAVRSVLASVIEIPDDTSEKQLRLLERIAISLENDIRNHPPLPKEREALRYKISLQDRDLMTLLEAGLAKRQPECPCLTSIMLGVAGMTRGGPLTQTEATKISSTKITWIMRLPVVMTLRKSYGLPKKMTTPAERSQAEAGLIAMCNAHDRLACRTIRGILAFATR